MFWFKKFSQYKLRANRVSESLSSVNTEVARATFVEIILVLNPISLS